MRSLWLASVLVIVAVDSLGLQPPAAPTPLTLMLEDEIRPHPRSTVQKSPETAALPARRFGFKMPSFKMPSFKPPDISEAIAKEAASKEGVQKQMAAAVAAEQQQKQLAEVGQKMAAAEGSQKSLEKSGKAAAEQASKAAAAAVRRRSNRPAFGKQLKGAVSGFISMLKAHKAEAEQAVMMGQAEDPGRPGGVTPTPYCHTYAATLCSPLEL